MFDREKALLRAFYDDNVSSAESFINKKALQNGILIQTITSAFADNAVSLVLSVANPSVDVGRKVRIGQELPSVSAASVNLEVTRGANPVNHAVGAIVYNKDGLILGTVSTAIQSSSTDDLIFAGIKAETKVGENVTVGTETMVVDIIQTTLTIVRATGAAAQTNPWDLRDENGPYKLVDMQVTYIDPAKARGKIYLVLQDDN